MASPNIQDTTVNTGHFKSEFGAPTGDYNYGIMALIVIMGKQMDNYKKMLPQFKEEMQTLMFVQDVANCDDVDQVFLLCFNEVESQNPQVAKLMHVSRAAYNKATELLQLPTFGNFYKAAFLFDLAGRAASKAQQLMNEGTGEPHNAAYQFAKGIENTYAHTAYNQITEGGQIDHYTEGEQTQIFIDEAKQLGVDPEQAMDLMKSVAQAFKAMSSDAMALSGVPQS